MNMRFECKWGVLLRLGNGIRIDDLVEPDIGERSRGK